MITPIISGSSNYPKIDIYRYPSVISLTSCYTYYRNFLNCILNSNIIHIKSLPIYPYILEQYNIRYAEKWITRIDDNFLNYDLATMPPSLHIPQSSPPKNSRITYLTIKSFSGDVSGIIAESIFIYFLHSIGVNINLVGHIRPLKKIGGFLPDFLIYDKKYAMRNLISGNYNLPIYAEVKGSIRIINKYRWYKAITQLAKVLRQKNDCGIIFLIFKYSTYNFTYKAVVIEVRI